MKRRLFLVRSAVALSAVAAVAVIGVGATEAPVSLVGHEYKWYFEVNGTPEDCRKFVEAFQTHLWSEWRTHPNDMARVRMRSCFATWPEGVGRVSKDGKQCREALRKTLAQFANQVQVSVHVA